MIPGIPQVGGPELLILLVIILLLFGAKRFSSMAGGLGRLVGGTRRTVENAKSELIPEEIDEARHTVEDLRSETLFGAEGKQRSRKA
jgi:TatA/E family protein of Tat protein translocase